MNPLPLFFYSFSLSAAAVMGLYLVRHMLFTVWSIAHRPTNHKRALKWFPSVTIVIPAYNEEKVIGQLLKRLIKLSYKGPYDIVVVNDGSQDRTGEIADKIAAATNKPHIRVVHRLNGGHGKAYALNEALAYAKGEILVFFDADYIPHKNVIQKLLRGFSRPDVAAVQGYIKVRNHSRALISKVVRLERIAGYRVSQEARNQLWLMPQLGGTVMAVRRKALEEVNGFNPQALAEDTDLTLRLILRGYRVHYVLDAKSSEEAVESIKAYIRQRHRWAYGHMQCALRYSWKLLKSQLRLRVKFDALLCLGVYFVPLLVGMSWIVSAIAILLGLPLPLWTWNLSVFSIFSVVGNFAPIFEVIVGALLEKAYKALLWLPLIPIIYAVNVVVCAKAFLNVALARRCRWAHTEHNGKIR